MCVGLMRLGSYEIKTARLEESVTHLETALSCLLDKLPTSHYTADCALISFSRSFSVRSDCMFAGYFYLTTLFLAKKVAYKASLHAKKYLEIRKTIYPFGHRKISEGEKHAYIQSSLKDYSYFYFSRRLSKARR